jgi:hypothetical protein
MRKFLFIAAIALLGTVGLSACNHDNNQADTGTQAKATKPTDPNDIKAWQTYLSQIVEENMGNITNNPYVYFVPEVPPAVAAAVTGSTTGAAAAGTSAGAAGSPAMAGTSAGPGAASSAAETLARVQDQLNTVVQATVLPGNMVAAGGPSSATTAQVLETAFKQASPGSFKGVVVLFIGDQADEAAVKAAVEPSGAIFKFAQM